MNGTRSFTRAVRYFFVGTFIFVVVSAAVYLTYTLSYKQFADSQPPATHPATPPVVTQEETPTEQHTEPPAQPVDEQIETPAPKIVQEGSGKLTVYIASYVHEPPAAAEVGRWNDAGYISAVIHANDHYRVSLGRYETAEDAKAFADSMSIAFERGYWIGRIP